MNIIPIEEHRGRYRKRIATAEETYAAEVILIVDDDDTRQMIKEAMGYRLEF